MGELRTPKDCRVGLKLPDAVIMVPVSADGYSADQRTLARHQKAQDGLLPRLHAWTDICSR